MSGCQEAQQKELEGKSAKCVEVCSSDFFQRGGRFTMFHPDHNPSGFLLFFWGVTGGGYESVTIDKSGLGG